MPKTAPRETLEDVVDDVVKRLQQAERICTSSYRGELAALHGAKIMGIRKQVRICTVKIFAIAIGDESKSPQY